MKKTMVILVVMLVALTGCQETVGPKETVETAGTNAGDFAGVYALVEVNGSKLPTTLSHGKIKRTVYSGTFTINADGTCSSNILFGPPSGKKSTRKVNATYTQEGSTLHMKWKGAGWTKGTIKGDIFSMNNEGMMFVYKKNKEQ